MKFFMRMILCFMGSNVNSGFILGIILGKISKFNEVDDKLVEKIKEDFSLIYKTSDLKLGLLASNYLDLSSIKEYNKFEERLNLTRYDFDSIDEYKVHLVMTASLISHLVLKYCSEDAFKEISTKVQSFIQNKDQLDGLKLSYR